jgi:hypothetical protein
LEDYNTSNKTGFITTSNESNDPLIIFVKVDKFKYDKNYVNPTTIILTEPVKVTFTLIYTTNAVCEYDAQNIELIDRKQLNQD